ncbi:MAG: bcr [Gammaproteobacteria bacterium]|jgi:predicted MFS family arabinose efflux permease|nr:bcr [Gammaproteobacteria bacterium]
MNPIKPSMLTLFLLITFGAVNAVLFTPALPAISQHFAITASMTQLTISLYLIGYAVGQLLYGPIAKRLGFKKAIYLGIILCLFGIGLCLLASPLHNFAYLEIGRLLMALGASVGLMISFAIVSHCYSPSDSKKKLAYLMTGFALAPGISISIGGFIVQHLNWESCFYLLAAYALFITWLCSRLPDLSESLDVNALGFRSIASNYLSQIKNPVLVLGALLMGGCSAFIYVFSGEGPFISINLMHMPPSVFGIWSLLPSAGIFVGSQLSAICSKHFSTNKLLIAGFIIMAIGVIILLISLKASLHPISLFVPMFIIMVGNCMLYIQASIIALSNARDKSNASAMMSFLNMGLTTMLVFSLGAFSQTLNLLPMFYLGLSGLAAILMIITMTCSRHFNKPFS